VVGAKNLAQSLKILGESASYDFWTENEQRMLNSSTFCVFFIDKSVFRDFLTEGWRIMLKNRISARIYHEVLKNLTKSLRNFRRKEDMFSILGGKAPLSSS
jgi:hypothetical protein